MRLSYIQKTPSNAVVVKIFLFDYLSKSIDMSGQILLQYKWKLLGQIMKLNCEMKALK